MSEIMKLFHYGKGKSNERMVFDIEGISPCLVSAMGMGGGYVPAIQVKDFTKNNVKVKTTKLKKKMKKTIKWGSDFSGVGAADYALKRISEQKGYTIDTVYACDWDKYARITYEAAHGLPPYYPKDVYEREIPKNSLDLYVTSPPCQAFSLAGKRLGKEDKRGILFFNSHEFIQENKPRFFIFENVKGLLSDDGGKTFQEWVNMLGGKSVNGVPVLFPYEESVPYHIYWKVLNAKEHGIPQNRERVFIVGIRDDQDNSFTWPKEEPLKLRLKDVLEQEVFEKYFLNEKQVENMQASDFNQEKERIQDGDYSGTLLSRDYKAPKCVKVRSNLEKYYLSQKMIDGFMKHNENHEEKGTGFIFSPKDEDDVANCLRANPAICATDNTLKVGFINQDTQASQVFDESGTAPTIPAGTHGYAMGYVQVSDEENVDANDPKIADYRADEGLRIRKDGNAPCLNASMQDYPEWNPKAGTRNPPLVILNSKENDIQKMDDEVKIGALRGRNPENPSDRTTGSPTEQRLEINENGTSNALTTVQKDNLVVQSKDLFNSTKIRNLDGNKNHLSDEKRNTIEILFALQDEIGEKEVRAWRLRILEAIRQKEILWERMYESGFSEQREKRDSNNTLQPGKSTKIIANVIMRTLSSETWERCSSQRRKSIKQLIRKFSESLQIMSSQNTSNKTNMSSRELYNESKGIGLLREALSEIQEIWSSLNVQKKSIHTDYKIRRLTPLEAFRLMDFPDEIVHKAREVGMSDSQLYKQAGNSIVVRVLEKIFDKMPL